MPEVWKDIKGYESVYQISNLGNVRRVDCYSINKLGVIRFMPEADLKPWDNGKGYLVVSLHDSGKRKNHYIHRLVAEAFIPKIEQKNYVNHLDYNKHNNTVENLEWCTQAENVMYSVERMRKPRLKYKPSNTGEKYISKRLRNEKTYFCVSVRTKGLYKSFRNFSDALAYRNEVV